MRRTAIGAVAILMTAGLLSPTQAFAVDNVSSAKLRKAVTVSGILQHERALQRIANQNDGIRASGAPGFDASAKYVVKKLRKAGYKVHKQKFVFPFFQNLAPTTLSEVSPTARDFETVTLTYSGSGDINRTGHSDQ